MIPKTIHYCWFGRNKKPKLVRECIESWKQFCPDYQIIEWNEDNFDVNLNGYTKMCHEQHRWAYLSDYVRLYVVAKCGGIYFDTDVEALRSFDEFLPLKAFFGFEIDSAIATGLGFGSEEEHPLIVQMLKEYDRLLDGEHGVEVCTKLNTDAVRKSGFQIDGSYQEKDGVVLLPAEYLNPMDSATGVMVKTNNTFSVHHYSMSALSKKEQVRTHITRVFHRYFGVDCFHFLKRKR